MSTEKPKNNNDPEACKKIAQILRQRDSIPVSPIDLSLEITKPLNAGPLQWLNFYELADKMTLKNSGDTVMILGRWHHRPMLSGGPLDGHYIFSQLHYHWDSPGHEHNKHTINGKSNSLEMHALFYKSSYKTQAEAQENEDGVVIVVYFFKVEDHSCFQWLTDQLGHVTAPNARTQLPPAPLSAFMVPLTSDYLAYWGTLPCTCHHVLWMVSRSTLRITREQLEQFSKLQTDFKEKISNSNTKTVNVPKNVYKINPINDIGEVLFPDSVDPPCKIFIEPDKLTVSVDYCQGMASDIPAENVMGNGEPSLEKQPKFPSQAFRFQEKGTSMSDFHNDQQLCSVCKTPAAQFMNIYHQRLPGKTCILVSDRSALEIDMMANTRQIKILEKEKSKNLKKRKLLEFGRRESEVARRLLKKEKEDIHSMKKALDDELKRLALIHDSKETSPNNNVVDVANDCPKRLRSPNLKCVLTSKPNSVCGDQNNLPCEKENVQANNSNLVPNEHDESPLNTQNESAGDKPSIKEEDEVKKKAEPPKSRLPVRASSPWKSEGLQSTLTPYFRSSKCKPASEKQPDTPGVIRINTRIPKFNRRIVNRTVNTRQDLGGKGDQPGHDPKKGQKKPLGHLVSFNYLK